MTGRLRRIISHPAVKAGYLVLLLAAAGFYLLRWGDRLPDLLGQVRPAWVGAALVMACLSALLYSYIQYYIYRQLGAHPSYWAVFRIITVSQLGKYLPGKVLFFGNYYLFSHEAGIGNVQIGTSFVISMALWILTASLCGLPVLSLLEPAFRYLILILPLLLALMIHPRFLGWLLQITQQTLGRLRGPRSTASLCLDGTGRRLGSGTPQAEAVSYGPPTAHSPDGPASGTLPAHHLGSGTPQGAPTAESPDPVQAGNSAELGGLSATFYLRGAFLYLATWALAGVGATFCLAAFTAVDLGTYPLALASIALGTVGGFLALFAPVGLGVREGIGVLILSPVLGVDVALLGMILLRGVSVVVDLGLALLGVLSGRLVALPSEWAGG